MTRRILVCLVLSLFYMSGCKTPNPVSPSTDPQVLAQTGAKIIDVRTPEEFNAGHIKGAINIPYDEIGKEIEHLTTNKKEPLLVHCRSGGRSAIAAATLRSEGYTNVTDLGSLDNARRIVGR